MLFLNPPRLYLFLSRYCSPLDGKHGADSGLAHSLDEPSRHWRRIPQSTFLRGNGNCATVRLESPGYGSLSVDQVRADWILRDVSDIEFQHRLKEARTLGETVGNLLKLQELTPTCKQICTTELHCR